MRVQFGAILAALGLVLLDSVEAGPKKIPVCYEKCMQYCLPWGVHDQNADKAEKCFKQHCINLPACQTHGPIICAHASCHQGGDGEKKKEEQ